MKKKYLVLALLLSISHWLVAQNTITLQKLNATTPIEFKMPIMMDSINLKGKKFEAKDLLATEIQLPIQSDYHNMVDAMDDVILLEKPIADYQIQFLAFQLISDRYAKATIKITSPTMLELYANDKKEGTKSTEEDNFESAKSLSKEVTLLPNQSQQIIIKYLSTPKTKKESNLKVEVTAGKKFNNANLSLSYDGKRFTNVKDGLEGVRATITKTSPKGDYALISYRSVDKEGKARTFTELRNIKSGVTVNLGTQIVNWMPKSNRYYYLQKYATDLQLVSVDPSTMEETILARNIPMGSFSFSPDETFLIYYDSEKNDERKGDLKLLLSPEDRQPNYLNRSYLSKYDLKTGVKQRLTYGKLSTSFNDISADSRYIIYSCSQEKLTERPFRTSSLYKLDLMTMSIDTLWKDEKFISRAKFSPDASKLIVTGGAEAFGGIGLNIKEGQTANSYDTQAFIYDINTKHVEPITKNFNPAIKTAYWNKTDNLIYLLTIDRDCEPVYTYNPKNNKFNKLDMPEDVINNFSIASNANLATYVGKSITNPVKTYSFDIKSGKATLLDDSTAPFMSTIKLGEVKDWSFTASDGTTIEGFYHLPPNFDPTKKYPMIVYYYGGTTPTPRTFEHPYSMHNFAALGYVVYTIQPSGAIGYGQEFAARHVNAWGKRTAEDIIEGTKQFVKEHSFVNGDKIGCVGASYGGFMTMYLQTQTDLFAAAISHAGISSISSYWGEGYWGYTYSSGASANSYPWNNKELYVEQSPLFNADKINTPILFTHGTVDTNVPIGESIQMYTALKILGKPAEFIQVKEENHGVAAFKKRIEWSYSMYAWFDKWLKDQPEWWDSLYPNSK